MPWARVPTGDGGARVHSRCPSGYVCIYPEINFGGQPRVRRASGTAASRTCPPRSPTPAARSATTPTAPPVSTRSRNHAGRWVCATRSGGSIHDRPTSGP
ncbi:peptidase inhibitor family I36 protein [Streptomyces sp. NPDC006175]|uniref:peptidase inhibitor family I36 protein n=1 Tax=Streptomyces sp. NPDC006175 TaxID=3154471 RepID=UPI0033B66FB8